MAGDEKSSVCGLCGNTIKPRGNALKCGSNCEKWFHIECVNISKIEYNNVKTALQVKGVNWTCEPCQELTSANSDSERSGLVLEKKIDKLFEIVKGLVTDNLLLNEKFDNAFDLGKSKNILPVGCLTITSNDVSRRPMKAKDIVEVHETPNNDKRVSDNASSDLQDAPTYASKAKNNSKQCVACRPKPNLHQCSNNSDADNEGFCTVSYKVESRHERCQFPGWVVSHHHWHSLDNGHSYHFSHKNATLRITREHGPTEMRLVCHHIVANSTTVTLVAHATAGCKNGYICMVFHKRDSAVIQVQQSNKMVQDPSEACIPPFTDPYQMSSPVTLITVSLPETRCPLAGQYIASSGQATWTLPSDPDPLCHSNTTVSISCFASPNAITFQTCSSESSAVYNCHGTWSDNRTTYVIASPVSRKSTDAKRYCFILNQRNGYMTLHRLSDSCNLSANRITSPLNLTLQGSHILSSTCGHPGPTSVISDTGTSRSLFTFFLFLYHHPTVPVHDSLGMLKPVVEPCLAPEVCNEQECRSSCCNVRAQALRVYPVWLNESTPGPGDLG
ncbi:hypothetical protein J6590_009615 [Homalodisca vitripennis]|nr:hypothetical protein J6590_009615 [Homalodisca vitripennis]